MVGGILHRPLSIKNAKLMETHSPPIESLIERTEKYLKTGLELYRLKAIGKSADVFSSLVSKLAIISFFIFFFLLLNTGLALWIGDLLGKSYFGFFTVASFYAIAGIFIYIFRDQWIKNPLRNSIITQTLN